MVEHRTKSICSPQSKLDKEVMVKPRRYKYIDVSEFEFSIRYDCQVSECLRTQGLHTRHVF